MSDYISGLASRALGLSGGIRPKVPSLFEPVENHSVIFNQKIAGDRTAQKSRTWQEHSRSINSRQSFEKSLDPESANHLTMTISSGKASVGMLDDVEYPSDPNSGKMQRDLKNFSGYVIDPVETGSRERLSTSSKDRIGEGPSFHENGSSWADSPGVGSVAAENLTPSRERGFSQNSRDDATRGKELPLKDLNKPIISNTDVLIQSPLTEHSAEAVDQKLSPQSASKLPEFHETYSSINFHAKLFPSNDGKAVESPKPSLEEPQLQNSQAGSSGEVRPLKDLNNPITVDTEVLIQSPLTRHSVDAIDQKFLSQSSAKLPEFQEAYSSINPYAKLFLPNDGRAVESTKPSLEEPRLRDALAESSANQPIASPHLWYGQRTYSLIDRSKPIDPSAGRMQAGDWQMKRTPPINREASTTSEETPVPPTIKVTIGRIEVKAVSSSAKKAPSPAPRSQSISLDEYLLSLKRYH